MVTVALMAMTLLVSLSSLPKLSLAVVSILITTSAISFALSAYLMVVSFGTIGLLTGGLLLYLKNQKLFDKLGDPVSKFLDVRINEYIRKYPTLNVPRDISKEIKESIFSDVVDILIEKMEKGIRYNNRSAKLFLIGNVFLIGSLVVITASLLFSFGF